MAGRAKPFVVYQRGPAFLPVVPRGFMGWFQLSVWIALLAAHIVWFRNHVEGLAPTESMGPGLFLFCMGVVAWLIGCFWWMTAHAEVVDYVMLKRELKRRRQKQESARRGDEGDSNA